MLKNISQKLVSKVTFNSPKCIGLFLFLTPFVTGYCLAAKPIQAATLSAASGGVLIGNFSNDPLGITTLTNTETLASTKDGFITTSADAYASFVTPPASAFDLSTSVAMGVGYSYFGEAISQSLVSANFQEEAGQTFSFDFIAGLGLLTSVTNSQLEQANASGVISLALFDTTDSTNKVLLDSLTLFGTSTSNGSGFGYEYSDSITPGLGFLSITSGENQTLGIGSLFGNFSRTFTNFTKLELVEVTNTAANVNAAPISVPEPSSSLLDTLGGGALLGIGLSLKYKLKKQKKLAASK